ncbi:hypothetical protein ACFE04_012251 [Oxalis oulophora]
MASSSYDPETKPKLEAPTSPHQQLTPMEDGNVYDFSQRVITMQQKSEIETLKEEIFSMRMEREFCEKKAALELKKHSSEIEALKEQNASLVEEKYLITKRLANLEGRERNLWEKLKNSQAQCAEVEFRREKMDSEVNLWKERYVVLDKRVASLQGVAMFLANRKGLNLDDHGNLVSAELKAPMKDTIVVDVSDDD